MFMNTFKNVAGIALAIIIVGGTAIGLLARSYNSAQAAKFSDGKEDKSSKKADGKQDEKIKALLQEMVETAKEELGSRMREFEAGRGTLEFLCDASIRLLNAERELTDKRGGRLAALEAHLKRMKKVEGFNKKWQEQGRVPNKSYELSKYYRLQAEVWLERAKAEK